MSSKNDETSSVSGDSELEQASFVALQETTSIVVSRKVENYSQRSNLSLNKSVVFNCKSRPSWLTIRPVIHITTPSPVTFSGADLSFQSR